MKETGSERIDIAANIFAPLQELLRGDVIGSPHDVLAGSRLGDWLSKAEVRDLYGNGMRVRK